MARSRRRAEHRRKTEPPRRRRREGRGTTTREKVSERGRFPPSSAPADAQSAQPADYPNDDAVFTTGPGQAVQYHYTRQDLYNEQFAQEQIAAEQESASAGSMAVPGPGTTGVSYG